MEKGALYIRVSNSEQAEEGYSLQSQEKEGLAYAARKNIEIGSRIWRASESARRAGRKIFNDMLEYVKAHPEVRHILFEKPDRMCRNYYDYLKIHELLNQQSKQIHFFKAGLVIDKDSRASEKLNLDIQVVMARHQIENLSEETRKGLKAKAEEGIYPGWAPTGYFNNTATKNIEVDHERAPKVQRLFRLAAAGDYSIQALVKIAFDSGLRVRGSGSKLYKSGIHKMLKNPFYYGYFQYKGVLQKGTYPPLISKQLFDSVQEALQRRQKPKKAVHNFALGGFLTCSRCGCSVVGEIQKKRYIYYHCTYGRGKCGSPYIREETLFDKLGETVRALEIPLDTLDWIRQAVAAGRANRTREWETQVTELTRKHTLLHQRLGKLYEDKQDGKIDEKFWQERHNAYRAEMAGIAERLEFLKHNQAGSSEDGLHALELSQQMYPQYVKQPPREKRALLKMLLSNCALDGVTPIPTYRSPFDLIAEGAKNKDWGG